MSERAALATKKTEKKAKKPVSSKSAENFSQVVDSPAEQILHLQRTIGNRAVQRLIRSGKLQTKLKIDRVSRLTINQPGDKYEMVAGRMADKIVRQEDEKEKEVSAKQLSPQAEAGSTGPQANSGKGLESRLAGTKGGGQPLPTDVRSTMEPRFGADFSNVRVHTGGDAIRMNKEINAQAFTHGSDIYFGSGKFHTGTGSGQRLIAHELTHTLQQGATARKKQSDISIGTTTPKIQGGWFSRVGGFVKRGYKAVKGAVKKGVKAVTSIAEMGLDWVLGKIKPHIRNIPGYNLITVIIGKDLVTGKKVPRTPENFIKGLLGKDRYDRLNKSGAISDAFKWLNTQVKKLNISFSLIWELVKKAGNYFIKNPSKIFSPFSVLKKFFSPPISRIWRFIKAVGGKILEFIFKGVLRLAGAPVNTIMKILNKGAAILGKIIKDPIGFARNLLKAVKMGFNLFTKNFVKHLKASITNWLFGTLSKAGIELPKKFDLKGIFSLVAQILGLTYQNIRAKIVAKLGPRGEQIVSGIEKTVTFVKEFITKGPIVLWEKAKAFLGNLKEMVFGAIIDWVKRTIVGKAVIKILSMLNPVGALFQAAMAIFDVIMFFYNRWNQIKSLVQAIFNSIAPIVQGRVGNAAKWIEQVMGRGLTVIISFLARLIGLGGISQKIRGLIDKIRKPIDNAIDKIITWIINKGKSLFGRLVKFAKGAKGKIIGWWKKRKKIKTKSGAVHDLYFNLKGKSNPVPMVASEPMTVAEQLAKWEKSTAPSKDAANLLRQAKALNVQLDAQKMSPGSTKNPPSAADKRLADETDKKLGDLATIMRKLYDIFGKENLYKAKRRPDGTIEGKWEDFDWTNPPAYPSHAVTPHPINKEFGYQNSNKVPTLRAGKYVVGEKFSRESKGAPGGERKKWRKIIREKVDKKKEDLKKKYKHNEKDKYFKKNMENMAKNEISKSYDNMPYLDLFLLGWECHHIRQVKYWNGSDAASNLQYLKERENAQNKKKNEHSPFKPWWNNRKKALEKEVGK